MEKTKTYKSVVYDYSSHEIHCNRTYCYPSREDIIENATITFNDNGTIILEGECINWGFELHDVHPSELDYEVDPKYIEKTHFLKKDIIRVGWHKKVKRTHIKITLSNFVIIES